MGKYLPIIKIAQCGSFNKAAGELGYSQPNLWHIVNNLEAELGARIFHRSRQGVTLTDAGATLLERMERIEAQESSLYQIARGFQKEQLRVGTFPGLPGQWVPSFLVSLLAELRAERPRLQVTLETPRSYQEGLAGVAAQNLDCCFSVLAGDRETEALPLWEDPYYLALPAAHPLAQGEAVSLDALDLPLILSQDSRDLDSPLWEVFQRARSLFAAGSSPMDPRLSLALAEKGLGAVLLSKLELEGLPQSEALRCLPLAEGLSRTVTLLCKRKGERSALAEFFLGELLGAAEKRTKVRGRGDPRSSPRYVQSLSSL